MGPYLYNTDMKKQKQNEINQKNVASMRPQKWIIYSQSKGTSGAPVPGGQDTALKWTDTKSDDDSLRWHANVSLNIGAFLHTHTHTQKEK